MHALQKFKTDVIGCDCSKINRLSYIDCLLDIQNNGTAEIYSSFKACKDTDSVTVSIFLQCNFSGTWTTVKYWSRSYSNVYGAFDETYKVECNKKYRMLVNIYAYSGEYVDWMSTVVDGR